MESLGQRIREIRHHKGLTIEAVAQKAEISASSLSYIERGLNSPTAETMQKIAGALGVSVGDLLGAEPRGTHNEDTPADTDDYGLPPDLVMALRGKRWHELKPETRRLIASVIRQIDAELEQEEKAKKEKRDGERKK